MKDLQIRIYSPINAHSTLSQIKNIEGTLNKAKSHLNCDWWLSAGTAIGLYRDGDFIPNDTDIDIGVKAVFGQKHIQIPGFRLIRTMDWRGRPIQTAFVDDTNGCIFDIYYYYTDIIENKLVSVSEYGYVYYKKSFIVKPLFEIKELETKYGKFPFLDPIEDYLVDRYGENWRTPSDSKGKYVNLEI